MKKIVASLSFLALTTNSFAFDAFEFLEKKIPRNFETHLGTEIYDGENPSTHVTVLLKEYNSARGGFFVVDDRNNLSKGPVTFGFADVSLFCKASEITRNQFEIGANSNMIFNTSAYIPDFTNAIEDLNVDIYKVSFHWKVTKTGLSSSNSFNKSSRLFNIDGDVKVLIDPESSYNNPLVYMKASQENCIKKIKEAIYSLNGSIIQPKNNQYKSNKKFKKVSQAFFNELQ